ncbi:hypothetical protein BGX27_000206 [Mortierella sp. AM989]|nr:hypothetical protein BGX27_000206 [Mortierella sp. AM989]
MPVAILFIGNTGAGKSALLSLLGGEFKSGVKCRKGYTKDIYEKNVVIEGKPFVLIDAPGLFEPQPKETEKNVMKLTEALGRGYSYLLYFVLKANNRGPTDEDMVMMSKVNECVRQAGSKAIFRVIINQIQDKQVYDMYEEFVARDNCETLFQDMKMEGFSFDIMVSHVLLFRFDEAAINGNSDKEVPGENQIKHQLREDILIHYSSPALLEKPINATNGDISTFLKALLAMGLG